MFYISVALTFMLCAICKGLQCDVTKQYQLVQNKASTEILGCPKCGLCKSGSELDPPCGAVVVGSDQLRNCKPCNESSYSATEDMLQCQQCQSATCFAHQIVVGICKKYKPDTSRCTGCEDGYFMNSDATACEVVKLLKTTDQSTVTTKGPTLSNRTDGETGLSVEKTGMSVGDIIAIVMCSILIVTLPIVGLCCCVKCRNQRLTQRGKDEENISVRTSTTFLNEPKDEEKETIQEEDRRNGLPTSDGLHVKETIAGFVDSSQSNNVGNEVSDAVMDETQPAMSPELVLQNRREEPLIPQRASAVIVQNSSPANNPHHTRFGDLSVQTYDNICVTFDVGAFGKDWRALAGWLDLKTKDVDQIEIKGANKTSEVIKTWAVATQNTVVRFVQILENPKHGMTHLADEIKAELMRL